METWEGPSGRTPEERRGKREDWSEGWGAGGKGGGWTGDTETEERDIREKKDEKCGE